LPGSGGPIFCGRGSAGRRLPRGRSRCCRGITDVFFPGGRHSMAPSPRRKHFSLDEAGSASFPKDDKRRDRAVRARYPALRPDILARRVFIRNRPSRFPSLCPAGTRPGLGEPFRSRIPERTGRPFRNRDALFRLPSGFHPQPSRRGLKIVKRTGDEGVPVFPAGKQPGRETRPLAASCLTSPDAFLRKYEH
jgi:hypothetical protein